MKKLLFLLLMSCSLINVLSSCRPSNKLTDFDKICTLSENYSPNEITYEVISKDKKNNITLKSLGTLTKINENEFSYNYVYQYLNMIDSSSKDLITTIEDQIEGSAEEITKTLMGYEYPSNYDLFIFDIKYKEIIDSYNIEIIGNLAIMKGTLKTNLINALISDISEDAVINYTLKVNSEYTKLIQFSLSYSTEIFDSIVITIDYN